MKTIKTILITTAALLILMQTGCGSMFAHLFGSDKLKEKKYKFLMFDEFNSKVMYGGYLEISKVDDVNFSGQFKIIDVFAESIPVGSGKLEGKQNEDKDKADMSFTSSLSSEKIQIQLDRTWNLLEGNWSYKTSSGKFIAFDD
ncbi:MAG: hypothetical protein HY959_14370 [Ignavibacteriae bacterium]|nr:hypothetical protein [Ignavibacteriota bacterium]